MKCGSFDNPTKPTLLVQGTGGGKSSVYQCIGVIKRGVSLIVQNTLSLSSDQVSKIKKISERIPCTFALQLDSIKEPQQQSLLIQTLTSLSSKTNNTFFLFASPECIMKQPWYQLIDILVKKELLRLVCFDEVHLFVSFGLSFRLDFIRLRESLFKKLQMRGSDDGIANSFGESTLVTVPILFMTATFNHTLLMLLQKMTGLALENESFHWSDCSSFKRRNINIELSFSSYKTKIIKQLLKDHLSINLNSKAIIYSSVARSTEKIQDTLDVWLDDPLNIDGDTILINGDLEPEWKFVCTQCFTQIVEHPNQLLEENVYFPRILVATSGCIGAGLDSPDVDLVIRDGFPSSLLDLIQEMGRCGRGQCQSTNDKKPGHFHMIVNIDSFIYLIERLYTDNNDESDQDKELRLSVLSADELRSIECNNLLSVLRIVFLKSGCWHVALEKSCASTNIEQLTPCETSCPYCNDTMDCYIMTVQRRGLISFLIDTFIRRSDGGIIDIKKLISHLRQYDNVGTKVFTRRVNTAYDNKYLGVIVLQLIASRILIVNVVQDEEGKSVHRLNMNVVDDVGSFACSNEDYWQGINYV
jgi:superfamily II DNA helicase RecQ